MSKYRNWLIGGLLLIIAAAAFFYFQSQNNAGSSEFQTTPATRGNLIASVGATGTVRANQTVTLTWQTSGTVDVVNYDVGDMVQAGDVLASISQESLPQNIILAQAELVSSQQALVNLTESRLSFAQTAVNLFNAKETLNRARSNRNGMNDDRADDETIQDAWDEYQKAESAFTSASSTFYSTPSSSPFYTAAQQAYDAAKSARNYALARYNWFTGVAEDLDFQQADAQVMLAEAQVNDFQREYDRLLDGPDANDIAAAEARIAAAQATLNLSSVRAPFNGTVTLAQPLPGDQVSPGVVAFRVDDLSHLLVDVQISEVDINSVVVGQPVSLVFDAVLGKEYAGKVIKVGQVGTVVSGAVTFTVTVELLDADEQVKPGMTAAVNITVREVKDVLLVPNRAVRMADGVRVVYVLRDGLPEMIEIRLGATSDLMSEVISDELKAGDLVILNPPVSTFGGPPRGGMGGGN